eukprot:6134027-Pyramimonas_sp.AAC.1
MSKELWISRTVEEMRQGDHPCQRKVKIHKSSEKDSTDDVFITRVGSACTFPQRFKRVCRMAAHISGTIC